MSFCINLVRFFNLSRRKLKLVLVVTLFTPAPSFSQSLYFEPAVREGCSGNGMRQWAAIITGRGYAGDWVAACARTTAIIEGAARASRNCAWAGARVWGKFDVPDASCTTSVFFMGPQRKQCIRDGIREYAAIITGNNFTGDWIDACRQTTLVIAGAPRTSRDCAWTSGRVWGMFDVPDESCATKLYFETPTQKDCVPGTPNREYAAIITGENYSGDWVAACQKTMANIGGALRHSRDCAWAGSRVWGKFDVPDEQCRTAAGPAGGPLSVKSGKRASDPQIQSAKPCGNLTRDGQPVQFTFSQICNSMFISSIPVEACTRDEGLELAKKHLNNQLNCWIPEAPSTGPKPASPPSAPAITTPCIQSEFRFCVKCDDNREVRSASGCTTSDAKAKLLGARPSNCTATEGACP